MPLDDSGDVLIDAESSAVPASVGSLVQKTPGICGGDACIRNTRITVWGLIQWRKLGLSDSEVLQRVPGLSAADLAAACDYYRRNREEIEQAIRDNEES